MFNILREISARREISVPTDVPVPVGLKFRDFLVPVTVSAKFSVPVEH